MKVEVHIDPQLTQTQVVIRAPARSPQVEQLVRQLEALAAPSTFTVFRDGEARLLPLPDILRFYADGKGVSCQTTTGTYTVRERLYELEEALAGTRLVRVSHSEVVNLNHVTALDLSLTGTIKMTLAGGTTVYVSRRYVKKIKQALDL